MNNLKIIDLLYKYRNFKKIGLVSEGVDLYLNNLLSSDKNNSKSAKENIIKKKYKKIDSFLFINATTKNTHVTFSDETGDVLHNISLGNLGYKKSTRSSIFPTANLINSLNSLIQKNNLSLLGVKLKGFGRNRRFLIRKLSLLKISIGYIQDISFLPHNGCRSKKRPRK